MGEGVSFGWPLPFIMPNTMDKAQLALWSVLTLTVLGLSACLHSLCDFKEPRWIITLLVGLVLIVFAGLVAFLCNDSIIRLLVKTTALLVKTPA